MAKSELVISTLANRTGLYLCTQEGNVITPIARFTKGQQSAKVFIDWAVKAGATYTDAKGE